MPISTQKCGHKPPGVVIFAWLSLLPTGTLRSASIRELYDGPPSPSIRIPDGLGGPSYTSALLPQNGQIQPKPNFQALRRRIICKIG